MARELAQPQEDAAAKDTTAQKGRPASASSAAPRRRRNIDCSPSASQEGGTADAATSRSRRGSAGGAAPEALARSQAAWEAACGTHEVEGTHSMSSSGGATTDRPALAEAPSHESSLVATTDHPALWPAAREESQASIAPSTADDDASGDLPPLHLPPLAIEPDGNAQVEAGGVGAPDGLLDIELGQRDPFTEPNDNVPWRRTHPSAAPKAAAAPGPARAAASGSEQRTRGGAQEEAAPPPRNAEAEPTKPAAVKKPKAAASTKAKGGATAPAPAAQAPAAKSGGTRQTRAQRRVSPAPEAKPEVEPAEVETEAAAAVAATIATDEAAAAEAPYPEPPAAAEPASTPQGLLGSQSKPAERTRTKRKEVAALAAQQRLQNAADLAELDDAAEASQRGVAKVVSGE